MEWLTGLNLVLIVAGASFVAGVVLSQKVKDWLSGVPSDIRAGLKNVETVALAKVRAAQATVITDLKVAAGVQPPPPAVAPGPPSA